jgi:membrane-associated protease RseP (regulator of RpoE activity)
LALVADPPAELREYWLGIECSPVPPVVRAQLNLPEKQGLLVEAVVPESPAAKAGIVQYDILLRAGDKPLADPRDLVQSVQAVKDGKLAMELIHGGQRQTIEATPTRRPEMTAVFPRPLPGSADWETVQKWLEQMQRMQPGEQGQGHGPLMHFRVVRPGAILPPFAYAEPPLPPNMSIVISKEGGQPAKIVVKRGDEKWEVTEKELDKLPADVRPHVEHMLGRGGLMGAVTWDKTVTSPRIRIEEPAPEPGRQPSQVAPSSLESRLEKRLETMERRIEKLMHALEETAGGRARQKAPEEHGQK